MKIRNIEAIPFSIPYSKPLKYGLKGYLQSADHVLVRVTTDQAFSYHEASQVLPRMVNDGVAMVEEPIPIWDKRGRLKLSEQLSVPIIGDESVFTFHDVRNEIDLGAISIVSIKTPRTGYYLSRKIVHLAEQAGFPCIIGTQVETDVGALASAHFGAAFKAFSYPAELTYFLTMKDTLLSPPLEIHEGMLMLPKEPGLGAALDEEKLAFYRTDKR